METATNLEFVETCYEKAKRKALSRERSENNKVVEKLSEKGILSLLMTNSKQTYHL